MADEQLVESPLVGRASEPDPGRAVSPLLAAVRRPIPGGTGCGIDVSYDDDYLAIKAEIDKLGSVSTKVDQERAAELRQMMDAARGSMNKAGRSEAERLLQQRGSMVSAAGGPDYLVIRARAERILGEKSKDLRVATYLAFALWQTEGLAGLAEGMQAVDILLREFWEGLYPSKTRAAARRSAVDFLTSKLSETLEYAPVKETDRAPLELLQKVLTGLQAEFTRQMPEGPPSLLGMVQGVEKCLRRLPKPAQPAKPAALASPEKAPAVPAADRPASEAATPLSTVAGTGGELRSNQDAVDAIRRVSRFLKDQNRFNPTSFRLLRSLRWDGLTSLPPNEKGKTKFEPPPLNRRTFLAGLCNAGDWTKLLDEAEASFMQPGFHLWLDLQRLLVAALEGMGAEARSARQVVLLELALLTRRVPGLTGLTFADGTPLADPATAGWITETVLPALGTGPSNGSAQAAPALSPDGEWAGKLAEAQKLVEGGNLGGAVTLLQRADPPERGRRLAFRRKLAVADLCLRAHQPAVARPLFEELEEEIQRFSIQEWEPALALEVWISMQKCYAVLQTAAPAAGRAAIQQLSDRVFERICRLDVAFALARQSAAPAPAPTEK